MCRSGKAQADRESVRVVPHHTPAPVRELGRSTSLLPPGEPGGLVLSPRAPAHSQQQHHAQAPPGPATPCGLAHIDVSAAYIAGCPRSHTARLTVPVCTPFRYSCMLSQPISWLAHYYACLLIWGGCDFCTGVRGIQTCAHLAAGHTV